MMKKIKFTLLKWGPFANGFLRISKFHHPPSNINSQIGFIFFFHFFFIFGQFSWFRSMVSYARVKFNRKNNCFKQMCTTYCKRNLIEESWHLIQYIFIFLDTKIQSILETKNQIRNKFSLITWNKQVNNNIDCMKCQDRKLWNDFFLLLPVFQHKWNKGSVCVSVSKWKTQIKPTIEVYRKAIKWTRKKNMNKSK